METIWNIDSTHSRANFSIRHLMIAKVYGVFESVCGTLVLDLESPENSSVDATIDANSINTRNEERDSHIRSSDFLDTKKYPLITFKSTKVSGNRITGNLSIHGITRAISLDVKGPSHEFKDESGNTKISFSAFTRLMLKEFNLMWNTPLQAGGLMIGEDVDIELNLQFTKQL